MYRTFIQQLQKKKFAHQYCFHRIKKKTFAFNLQFRERGVAYVTSSDLILKKNYHENSLINLRMFSLRHSIRQSRDFQPTIDELK